MSELAQSDRADFSEELAAAQAIGNESYRARVLSKLAKNIPNDFLPQVLQAIAEITHKPTRAQVVSTYLRRLSLATLPHADWSAYLHLLAHRDRADLMRDLATLYPAIAHLGGDTAMRGVVDAMREVCGQWK